MPHTSRSSSTKWGDCLASLEQTLPDDALLALFKHQLTNRKALSEDLSHFDRLDDGHPEKTYGWLYQRAVRAVTLQRSTANLAAYQTHTGAGGSALPGADKGKGKGKGKQDKYGKERKGTGKGKSKDKPASGGKNRRGCRPTGLPLLADWHVPQCSTMHLQSCR